MLIMTFLIAQGQSDLLKFNLAQGQSHVLKFNLLFQLT